MECSLGDIDLNREQTDTLSDSEPHLQDHASIKSNDDVAETVATLENPNGVQMQQEEEASREPEQQLEEPEEGEISDDNDREVLTAEIDEKPELPECNDAGESTKEPSPTPSKMSVPSYDKWSHRSNGHGRHGGWNLRSEASPYPGQPDNFYQFAWAQGIQGSSKDSVGDSLQDETKARKTGDSDRSLHRSGSADRKSGWIVGDRGIEYVNLMRSDDGYLYLHEGLDPRRGDGRKGRSDKGSSERASLSRSSSGRDMEEKYRSHSDERSSSYDRDFRRRSESRRYSRDSRKREYREGDLEEGEIEGKLGMMAEHNRYLKSRDRHLEKPSFLSHSKGIMGSESPAHNLMAESHKDKLFADVSEYVRNVAVKDAQKSFMNVCRQLRRALRTLRDLSKDLSQAQGKHIESQQRKVLAFTRDVFSGIRAAYAVRNTAMGKEQEQNTNAFPRLLELARSRCQNLFTSKQIQELETMMQAIGYHNRTDYMKSHKRGYETERGEEKDTRIGESSGNTSATTQLESDSSMDTPANDRPLDHGDEAEQPLNPSADLHLGEISMAQPINLLDSSTAGTVGFGGWFSLTPEQGDSHGYGDAKDADPVPSAPTMAGFVDLNEDQSRKFTALGSGMDAESRNGKLSNANSRDAQAFPSRNHAYAPHFDPVRALDSYREKFGGKSQTAYARLPSPTPSDEEGGGVKSANEASGVAGHLGFSEGQQAGNEAQQRFFAPVISSHQGSIVPFEENHGRPTPAELTLFPNLELPPYVEDGKAEGHQAKLAQLRGSKKSRDPRRRLVSQPFDLELLQPDSIGNEGLERTQWPQESVNAQSKESTGSKLQISQVIQENLPPKREFVSLTLATGGRWLAEQQMSTSSKEAPANIGVVDTGSSMSLDSASKFLDDVSLKKRQIDFLNEESSSKRPKVAVIIKGGDDVAQPKVSTDSETSAFGDELKQGVISEALFSQGATLSKQTASILESMVKELPKPRMKPRDPRRALLGSILEKSKSLALAPSRSESTTAASSSGGNTLAAQASGDSTGSNMLPILTRNPTDKPLAAANMSADPWSSSLIKNENASMVGSSGMLQVSDSAGSTSKLDDLSRQSKAAGVEAKMAVIKPPSKFDLNVSAAANSKQQNINHWDHLEPLLEGLDERQKQAVRQERARRIEEQSRMFVAKKLCLVLDLDHTLLNSAKFTEIEGEWEAKLQANELTERNKFSKEGINKRELYRFQHMGMWTKLRPGIWNFLARASHLYELHVYTMGNKAYATEMAKLLDPTGALFAGRVISKGDDGDITDGDERPPKSKDLDGVLGMESAVVIIDDSARVWPHHRHNLIVVERYMYFPCSRKQFGLPGPSLLEVGHDEREQDGMLASALMVIEKIHYSFFSNPRLHEVDVRDILAKEQRRVLAGCKLVFSRVFPQGEIQPHLHPLWQLAEQFGAVCSINIDDGVTHVVAISLGTEKVNWALATGRFVVRPSWLEASAILYRRASERDFSVSP